MKKVRTSILKTAMAFMLVIAMAAGMSAWLGNKAEALTVYTLTFHGNGGYIYGQETWEASYGSGSLVPLPDATRVGYKLRGYSYNKGTKTPTYEIGEKVRVYNNWDLYAVWEGFYTVRYDYGHGDILKKEYSCNKDIFIPFYNMYTENGNIIGWSLSPNATKPMYEVGEYYAPLCKYGAGLITLYPVRKK